MKNDFWKILACALTGMVVTGATSWMAFGQDKVTRPELIEYVAQNSPWVRASGEITSKIQVNRESLQELKVAVERLVDVQNLAIIEQRVLVEQVKQLLKAKE